MSKVMYLLRDKKTESKINYYIEKYNLGLCSEWGEEKLFRNENMFFSLHKKYICIIFLSDEDNLFSRTGKFFSAQYKKGGFKNERI